ncbi:MAG: methyltransferase domain-containing protein [Steroidobacteraceae bacterium]|nr:methyltransferase domain-containing protein [Nevskiaceae bacterium]MCP5339347.1 methyltransferase domain-containing protein [Nevskiaceae bacterium]MCP5466530.1 methyltransferase domain-containing protein [Nevskiaceae bacterium]MCP5471372.1 methyltransferase domain-containing protein [Nevskiaceae bacterium]
MPAVRIHPMMPLSTHDEAAEQSFVVALKTFLATQFDPAVRRTTLGIAEQISAAGEKPTLQRLRKRLEGRQLYQNWISSLRAAQELMWQAAVDCVDRQRSELEALERSAPKLGSLHVDPGFEVPRYLAAGDVHMMPGGYYYDPPGDEHSVRQGAVFDKAASLYSLGRQGGQMNDMRGQTIVAHLYEIYPDLQPTRILEMGCTVGNSLVAVARNFPAAKCTGLDVGASLLRYARARAAHLGVALDFVQGSAEATGLPEASFDLVYSSAMLHETSHKALPRIMAECYRLLRPGGIMVHLEVPFRAEMADAYDLVRADFETRYNNEPFWMGATEADYVRLAREAGFIDIHAGFQDAALGPPSRDQVKGMFGQPNKGGYKSWYIASARKPRQ